MTEQRTKKSKRKDRGRPSSQVSEALRSIPSVDSLLAHEEVRNWMTGMPRSAVVRAMQCAVADFRAEILRDALGGPVDTEAILSRAEEHLVEQSIPSLRAVINATGIVLHTGLGRAPLSEAALTAITDAASGYCSLELDLATGGRGQRNTHVVELLKSVTGAEAAVVVNNNAAATLLILQTFASGREVIVSRGQLIEIGGSYRLPDIMRASGAKLREVGTTNRTRIQDYERAINEETALLLRAHSSNYRIIGFTEETPLPALVELAHRDNLLAVDDLGSGAIFDMTRLGLPAEPTVRESVQAGADLVCFSGDKLLGGPQCGIIVGSNDSIAALRANPLMRTYRVDKLALLALEATLRAFGSIDDAVESIPTLAMLTASVDELAERAQSLAEELKKAMPDEQFYVCSDVGYAGGGSLPAREMPTVVIQWTPSMAAVDEMVTALRESDPPVVTRIRNDAICFDLRTIMPHEFESLVSAATAIVWE